MSTEFDLDSNRTIDVRTDDLRTAATQDSHFPALILQNRSAKDLVSRTQFTDTYLNAATLNLRDEVLGCLQENVTRLESIAAGLQEVATSFENTDNEGAKGIDAAYEYVPPTR